MASQDNQKPQRIAKVIARSGLCSRRNAEEWILNSRVSLNGKTIKSPAVTVTDSDKIIVDGKPLPKLLQTNIWRYHKPCGLITTHKDEEGRPTVFENLPYDIGRVISVGRLDKDTSGLLLLTNDGELARNLELPSSGWRRTYKAFVRGNITADTINKLADGVNLNGIKYRPIKAVLDKNNWIKLTLTEGKKREVRRVLESLGHPVKKLVRLSFGDFHLGDLKMGEIEKVPQSKIDKIKSH